MLNDRITCALSLSLSYYEISLIFIFSSFIGLLLFYFLVTYIHFLSSILIYSYYKFYPDNTWSSSGNGDLHHFSVNSCIIRFKIIIFSTFWTGKEDGWMKEQEAKGVRLLSWAERPVKVKLRACYKSSGFCCLRASSWPFFSLLFYSSFFFFLHATRFYNLTTWQAFPWWFQEKRMRILRAFDVCIGFLFFLFFSRFFPFLGFFFLFVFYTFVSPSLIIKFSSRISSFNIRRRKKGNVCII